MLTSIINQGFSTYCSLYFCYKMIWEVSITTSCQPTISSTERIKGIQTSIFPGCSSTLLTILSCIHDSYQSGWLNCAAVTNHSQMSVASMRVIFHSHNMSIMDTWRLCSMSASCRELPGRAAVIYTTVFMVDITDRKRKTD